MALVTFSRVSELWLAIMACLLLPTRLALGRLPLPLVPDAGGLFNLMRHLGGAIGAGPSGWR